MNDTVRSFVYDENKVTDFAARVLRLPELGDPHGPHTWDATFLTVLFYNTKYGSTPRVCACDTPCTLTRESGFFEHRPITEPNASELLAAVRSYELPLDRVQSGLACSKCADMRVAVDQECLGVYAAVNPRSISQGALVLQAHYAKFMCSAAGAPSDEKRFSTGRDLARWMFGGTPVGTLLKTPASPKFLVIDIGPKRQTLVGKLELVLRGENQELACVIETRGGYHALVDTSCFQSDTREKLWQFMQLAAQPNSDESKPAHMPYKVSRDSLVPVPGTLQFGFRVQYLAKYEPSGAPEEIPKGEQGNTDVKGNAGKVEEASKQSDAGGAEPPATGKYSGLSFTTKEYS